MKTHDPRPTASRHSRPARAARSLVRAAAFTAAALAAVSTGVLAGERDRVRPERLTVYADVIDVRPVYREVRRSEPRRECWTEEQRHVVREGPVRRIERRETRHGRHRGTGDALVGGVIGGVIGNQLGRDAGSGARTGATIAGAIVGSAVANEASASARHRRERRHHYRHDAPRVVYETRPVERCRTVETSRSEQRLQHYDVTYRYEGRRYTTRLPRDPGPTLELEVSVRPARH